MSNKVLEKEFRVAYEKHSDAIFRFILFKIDNREKALDLTQETFMKMWLSVSKGEKLENPRAFLYTVAGNLVIDEYRRRERKDYHTDSLEVMSEDGYEPSGSLDEIGKLMDKFDGSKAFEMVKNLPEMYSEVVFMKYSEELSIPEIATHLSVTENVVSVRLNRAMSKLKDIAKKELEKYKHE